MSHAVSDSRDGQVPERGSGAAGGALPWLLDRSHTPTLKT